MTLLAVFECPECGYWRGESAGLYSKPGRCPKCVEAARLRKPVAQQRFVSIRDMAAAPMLVQVDVVRKDVP